MKPSGHWLPLAVGAAAVAARLVLLATPFRYVPDVLYYDSQAVRALAAGADPYGHLYVVPAYLATPGASNVFAYFPGVLLLLFPFGVASDVRLGLVFCDVVVAFSLASLGGRKGTLAALAFLTLPATALFSTWYPNDTLVAMAFLGGAVALEARGRAVPSAVSLGLALASSQFAWLALPFVAFGPLKSRRWSWLALSVAVAAAVFVPFFLWAPQPFVYDTVVFQAARPVQALVTPEAFGFNVNPTLSGVAAAVGVQVQFWEKAAVMLGALAVLLRRPQSEGAHLLNASLFLVASVFVLPNDFSWWYLELPFQTLLAWYVVRRGVGGAVAKA